jgi:cell division septation protein DedD
LTAHTDDGFHEIQLNGKQLVFLFMAATVVSVVIFLCGVLVGRGVRAGQGIEGGIAEVNSAASPAPQASAELTPLPESDPTAAAPPPANEDLSYFNRLEAAAPAAEKLQPPAPAPARTPERQAAAPPRAAAAAAPVAVPAAAAAAPAKEAVPPPAAARSEPPGPGYAVQIAALNIRSEADVIAKRLASKGYAAYVMSPAAGTPQIYRVRIGKFGSRREAESVATKLKKEEQIDPWVTR